MKRKTKVYVPNKRTRRRTIALTQEEDDKLLLLAIPHGMTASSYAQFIVLNVINKEAK
jgi:hypothetical protein